MTTNNTQQITTAAEKFINLAKELAEQESTGEVDQKLCEDAYSAAQELAAISDSILKSKLDEQLSELQKTLIGSENVAARGKRSYQASLGRLASTAVAGAVGTALSSFARGYFTRLGQQAADAYPVFGPNGIFTEGINQIVANNQGQQTITDQLRSYNENNWN